MMIASEDPFISSARESILWVGGWETPAKAEASQSKKNVFSR
jgi:hypothetical protein